MRRGDGPVLQWQAERGGGRREVRGGVASIWQGIGEGGPHLHGPAGRPAVKCCELCSMLTVFCELQVLLAGAAAACGTRAVSAWWGVGVGYGAAAAAMRDERRGRMEALALALACIATIVGFRV